MIFVHNAFYLQSDVDWSKTISLRQAMTRVTSRGTGYGNVTVMGPNVVKVTDINFYRRRLNVLVDGIAAHHVNRSIFCKTWK